MTARLTLAYDGRRFSGWSRQAGHRTVQGVVEEGLATILRRPVAVTCAGRTDAGVHALAQVVSYEGPVPLLRAANGVLPDDVAVLDAAEAPEGFDARRDALARIYRYRILHRPTRSPFERGRALWWPRPLDIDAMQACAAALIGRHDFTAFTPTQTEHVLFQRDVYAAEWRRDGDLLIFEIDAWTYMRNMNRILVGTMLEVGSGRRTVEDFTALLEGAPRSAAGATAPPHGLYLVSVRY